MNSESEFSERDGGLPRASSDPQAILQIYEVGEVTVVGFGGRDVPTDTCLAAYREQLMSLIREHGCRVMAFDLTGVRLVPSGLLGLIASTRHLGVEVQVFNPSDDVRDVFKTTRIDQVVTICDVAAP